MGNLLGCVKVHRMKVAVKENFGEYEKVLDPGCHCVPWCTGSRIVGHVNLRVQELDLRCEAKTKDNVFVTIVASIHYRALPEKAEDAFYKLSNTRGQIQAYVFDAIKSTVPKLMLNEVFEQKYDVAKAVDEQLETALAHYGYEIVKTLIVDIEPDEKVKIEIIDAARLRFAATEKAEAEKMLLIKRAEAEAEAKYRSGLGIAWKRQAVFDGLANTLLRFSASVPEISSKDVMDMILTTEYLDTMKEIRAHTESSAEVMPHGTGAIRDVVTQIRQGGLFQGSSS
ncbi:hypothetical protein MKX03_009641 [Papaver bracteatum]|nr:hypothetical protein MKX03_009641 [Papaver bracteatum]